MRPVSFLRSGTCKMSLSGSEGNSGTRTSLTPLRFDMKPRNSSGRRSRRRHRRLAHCRLPADGPPEATDSAPEEPCASSSSSASDPNAAAAPASPGGTSSGEAPSPAAPSPAAPSPAAPPPVAPSSGSGCPSAAAAEEACKMCICNWFRNNFSTAFLRCLSSASRCCARRRNVLSLSCGGGPSKTKTGFIFKYNSLQMRRKKPSTWAPLIMLPASSRMAFKK
mmetsp:Transcript_95398/g.309124  ORF Transcript_95398/g.309124 Transcript_95398/m.309124 type:complete len:222 (-) Transcript_95398:178-843(-)